MVGCNSPEDLRKLVICFYNLAFLISDRLMSQLVGKVRQFEATGQLREKGNLSLLCKLVALVLAKVCNSTVLIPDFTQSALHAQHCTALYLGAG